MILTLRTQLENVIGKGVFDVVHLYTLEGAIYNTEYNRLSEDTKK